MCRGVERLVARRALKGLKVSVVAALHEEPLMRRSLRSATAGVCLLLGLQAVVLMDTRGSGGCVVGGSGAAGGMYGECFPLAITNLSCFFPPSLCFLFFFLTQECNPG